MNAYLDTSVVLRKLLGASDALKEWGQWDAGFTSELTRIEAMRAFDRLRLGGELDDEEVAEAVELLRQTVDATTLIALDGTVLDRASRSFPTVVGTLDAIHLASAELYRDERKMPLVFLTHDRRLATAARALSFETRGV